MKDKNLELMEKAPVSKAILTLALPTVFSSIATLLYNLADTYFVGLLDDMYQLGAVSLAYPVFIIMQAIGSIFGIGVGPYISRSLGAKKFDEVKKTTSVTFYTSVMATTLLSVIYFLFRTPILSVLGTSVHTFELTKQYLDIVVAFAFTIPSTVPMHASAPIMAGARRRVAAYARVSTDRDDQFTSYEAQIDYYTNFINNRPDWKLVSIYSDEGITGCNTRKREGFNRMVSDALAGKIDLILTKSISRFARNTVDSLTTIRKLKEHNVEVFFEKENIWTFDGRGELMITIMSSLAQEESRSISENCSWGQRKRFADGKVSVPFGRFLGYDRGPDGNLVVNEEQAKIVRRIYAMFLEGTTPYGIAKALTVDGIPTPGKKTKWNASVIRSILTNEKYKGDALLQKVFTEDFLTKKKVKNEGEIER